jgi:hypothetical protein
MSQHAGMRVHACTVPGCSRVYTHPSLLRRHLQSAHRISLPDAAAVASGGGSSDEGAGAVQDDAVPPPPAAARRSEAAAAASAAAGTVPGTTGRKRRTAEALDAAAARRRVLPSAVAAAAAASAPIVYVLQPDSAVPPLPVTAPGAPVPLVFFVFRSAMHPAGMPTDDGGAFLAGSAFSPQSEPASALAASLRGAGIALAADAVFAPASYMTPEAVATSAAAAAAAAAAVQLVGTDGEHTPGGEVDLLSSPVADDMESADESQAQFHGSVAWTPVLMGDEQNEDFRAGLDFLAEHQSQGGFQL